MNLLETDTVADGGEKKAHLWFGAATRPLRFHFTKDKRSDMRFRFPSFSFTSGQPSNGGAALETVSTARAVVNDDGAILIDSEQGIMFSLNPTGGLLWAGLCEKATTEAISERLSQQFGVPETQAGQDVEEFIAILEKNRLVRRAGKGK